MSDIGFLLVFIFLCALFFAGDPDLSDALTAHYLKDTPHCEAKEQGDGENK